ncbi:MAG TPA: type II secretion system protein [Pseudomonadales bacterium]|nr:type II secretion system protein [Pseudomonadales bacterium]
MFSLRPNVNQTQCQRGLTLLETVVVMAILVALAAMIIPVLGNMRFGGAGKNRTAQQIATAATLAAVRDAILGSSAQPGLWQDLNQQPNYFPQSIADLYRASTNLPPQFQTFNPVIRLGWRGPYLNASDARYTVDGTNFTSTYGNDGDPAILDAWGRTIVLQVPQVAGETLANEIQNARLVSPGPDGIIQTPNNILTPSQIAPADRGDDVVLFLFAPDPQ